VPRRRAPANAVGSGSRPALGTGESEISEQKTKVKVRRSPPLTRCTSRPLAVLSVRWNVNGEQARRVNSG
jgi:hypothetical protein